MITAKQAAEKWGVTPRRVQMLCKAGEIPGAVQWGRTWMIPFAANLPNRSSQTGGSPHMPMPRKSPFLCMTKIYNRVGEADECALTLANNPEAQALFEAYIAYRRGDIDKVYERARYFLDAHSGFYAIIGGGVLLAFCAIWRGDIDLWIEAKKHICEAPCEKEDEREIVSLALAIVDSSIYDNKDYPEWFVRGSFEKLPEDSHPAAKVFYIKYLFMKAFSLASKESVMDDVRGLGLMKMMPYAIEPMISQALVEKTVVPEICLRLSCAVAYYYSGNKKLAEEHIDKALAIALPDRLYGIITEYVRHFDGFLEERIELVDPEAYKTVRKLYKTYSVGWSRLSGAMRNKNIATNITAREREIAKLVAFGYSIRDIAHMLYISESTVKQTILRVVQKTGIKDRSEFPTIL